MTDWELSSCQLVENRDHSCLRLLSYPTVTAPLRTMSIALGAGGSPSPRTSKRSWSEHELDGAQDSPSKTSSTGSLQSVQAPANSTSGHAHDYVSLSSGFTQPGSPALSTDGPAKLPEQRTSPSDQRPDTLTAKRRKTTAEEKLLKLVDKENKSKEKAELKAKREEEKRVKDEERRRKNEVKEDKKREKEMEKQQKEEEQRKKERVTFPLCLIHNVELTIISPN